MSLWNGASVISATGSMKLKINDSKTEFILIGTPQQLVQCTNTSVNTRGSVAHASDLCATVGCLFR